MAASARQNGQIFTSWSSCKSCLNLVPLDPGNEIKEQGQDDRMCGRARHSVRAVGISERTLHRNRMTGCRTRVEFKGSSTNSELKLTICSNCSDDNLIKTFTAKS